MLINHLSLAALEGQGMRMFFRVSEATFTKLANQPSVTSHATERKSFYPSRVKVQRARRAMV